MNFTDDPYGVKAMIVAFVLLAVIMVVWEWLGLDSGGGGTPYELLE